MKTEPDFVDFATIDEAEVELKAAETLNLRDRPYCPLIKTFCVKTCVCYNPARVREFKYTNMRSTIRLYGHFCGNAMFSGYRWQQ